MLFVGDDWAEDHHDVEVVDEAGRRLLRRDREEGAAGIAALHAVIADHLDDQAEPGQVVVGIETDRGPWVQALLAADFTVYAITPLQASRYRLQASRYRERHGVSGTKSDPADAHGLAELVRLERAHHRPIAGDSSSPSTSRSSPGLTSRWSGRGHAGPARRVRCCASPTPPLWPRSTTWPAWTSLRCSPWPRPRRRVAGDGWRGWRRRCATGRRRNPTATAQPIVETLHGEQLEAHPGVVEAYAAGATALVAVTTELVRQCEVLKGEVEAGFGRHPDAELYLSQPGLDPVLAARVVARVRRGPHPLRRHPGRDARLGQGPSRARPPLSQPTSGRRALPTGLRRPERSTRRPSLLRRPPSPRQQPRPGPALRALANRLVGVLHGCVRHQQPYNEATAWHLTDNTTPAGARPLTAVGCLAPSRGGPAAARGTSTSASGGPRARRERLWLEHPESGADGSDTGTLHLTARWLAGALSRFGGGYVLT